MSKEVSILELTKDELTEMLHNGIVEVNFLKKSTGEERTIMATLDIGSVSESEASQMSTVGKGRSKPDDLVTVWDTKKQGWRSFYFGNILTVKTQ